MVTCTICGDEVCNNYAVISGKPYCFECVKRRVEIEPDRLPLYTPVVADDGIVRMEHGVIVGVTSCAEEVLVYDSTKLFYFNTHDGSLIGGYDEGGPVGGEKGHRWYPWTKIKARTE